MTLRNVRAITGKEVYHLIRDFRSLYLAFAVPLLLILLFGYALSLDVENIETVVVDDEQTDLSRDFVRRLGASPYFRITAHLPDTAAVTEALDHGRATMAVLIPAGWTADLRADREAVIQILLDGSDPNFAGIARAYISGFIESTNRKLLIEFLNRQGMEKIRPPVEGRIRIWFNEDLESRNFIIPGIIAIIIMIVGAMLTSLVIAREYENGTMETIRSLPISAGELLLGKAIPYFLIGLTDVLIAVLMGQVLFGIVMKANFWLMILASSIYLMVALTLGLLISSVTKSQLVANQTAVLITYLPSLLLSNFVFPIINMPKFLQVFSAMIPATYYINILSDIYLKNLGFAYLWPDLAILTVMFLILAAANCVLLKQGGPLTMSWLRIREMVRKEFIQLFRDRKNRPILVMAPLIQLLVFGYVVNYDINDIRVALIDQSQTRESRLLIDAFTANRIFRITHLPGTPGELEGLLLAAKIDLGIKIPPDFSSRIRRGDTATVQIIADGGMSNMASVRISYTTMVLDRFNSELIKELYGREFKYGKIDGRIRTWYNPNLDSQHFFVPGIVAFVVMLISLLMTSIAIIKERENGTMEQLIVTPLKPLELIIGKTIPYTIIAIGQMVIVTLFALYWFEVPLAGSVFALFWATCLFLLSTLGIGLFISTVSKTQQQAMMTTFFFILPFFMLSGFVFPIANMPTVVQWLTYLNPLRYFLVIIRGIFLKGVGLHILWPQYAALAVLGIAVFTGAVGRFRKRLD